MLAAGIASAQSTLESRREEVFAAERAFARTMAERDFAAFGRYVAADCVFFSGNTPLRAANFISGYESMPVDFTPTAPVGAAAPA